MSPSRVLAAAGLALLAACQNTSSSTRAQVVEADAAVRSTLFDPVAALAGTWSVESGGETGTIVFEVTSAGSVVREIMFPGTEHEMTNMYTLDGNSLCMTHYCAAGNQPHMRARVLDGNRLAFETDGVSDLKAADDHYMGSMTLVLVDEDHVQQHWASIQNGEAGEHAMVFELTRVR